MASKASIEDIQSWLNENGFEAYCSVFKDNMIDGEALCCLTERALEILVPIIGIRMKMLARIEAFKKGLQKESVLEDQHIEEEVEYLSSPEVSSHEGRLTGKQLSPKVSQASETRLNAKLPWPSKIELPQNFRPEVNSILRDKDGQKLSVKIRRSIVTRLYEHFSVYTLYPTKHQLNDITNLLVVRYPFLKDKGIGTGHDSWFASLYEKFRNERRGISDDSEVILRKKRKGTGEKNSPVSIKLRRGAMNWEPPYPEGEDETSLKRHNDFLKNEVSRRSPDWDKINKRMDITFPSRRREMNAVLDITELRGEYPALFYFQVVIDEFERILGLTTSLRDSYKANFTQIAKEIVAMARELKKKSPHLIELLALLEPDEFEFDQEVEPTIDEVSEVAMAVLPFLIQARGGNCRHEDFIIFLEDDSDIKELAAAREVPYPIMFKQGKLNEDGLIHLVAGKEIICTARSSLVDGCLGLMAVFYVFMFHYPPGLTNFFIYLQKCILNIQDGKKLPKTVIDFVNALHSKSKKEH